MKEIIINGKKIKIKASFASVRNLLSKYGESIEKSGADPENSGAAWKGSEIITFGIEMMWEFIQPNWLGLKPYIFKKRFENKIDIADVRDNYIPMMQLLFGNPTTTTEDREQKKEI